MRHLVYICMLLFASTAAFGASGASVTYQVNGQSYEGYYVSPSDQAPFVLLIHDWDGLTDYEVKRANMLADLAKELESNGIDHEMITYGGAPHAFTVFGSNRYQEAADMKSWKRFKEFLADTLK